MINDDVRIWYCPNSECRFFRKNVRIHTEPGSEHKSQAIIAFGKCPECKSELKTMEGVIKK